MNEIEDRIQFGTLTGVDALVAFAKGKADVNSTTELEAGGYSLFSILIINGDTELVDFILEFAEELRLDANYSAKDGYTPLMCAIINKGYISSDKIVVGKMLVARGAKRNKGF